MTYLRRQNLKVEPPHAGKTLRDLGPNWHIIPNLTALDRLLAGGKVIAVGGLIGQYAMGGQVYDRTTVRYIQAEGEGYHVWTFDSILGHFMRHDYKNKKEFTTAPQNDVWAFLTFGKESDLYHITNMPIPAMAQLNSKYTRVPPLSGQQKTHLNYALIRGKWKEVPPDPDREIEYSDEAPNPVAAGKLLVLRTRKFAGNYGSVYMARLWNDPRGKYLVWTIASNLFQTDRQDALYGYPARYDIIPAPNYYSALDDYLSRNYMRRPVLKDEWPEVSL